jgi:hypothetical protein
MLLHYNYVEALPIACVVYNILNMYIYIYIYIYVYRMFLVFTGFVPGLTVM